MKCPICDREDQTISYDKKTGKYGDCVVCEAIIAETLDGYDVEEDEYPEG